MRDCKKATTSRTASTGGILRPGALAQHVQLTRLPADESVAPWVENHWALRWDLPAGRRYVSQVLPHPTCSLTIELGSDPRPQLPGGSTLVVTGVPTTRFDVDVRGWGRVVGVRFRPGGLAALTAIPASRWTDRVVDAGDALPASMCASLRDPDLAESPSEWAVVAESALSALDREPDERHQDLLSVVSDMLDDRSLVSVSQVCERHGYSARTLQRLFVHYIGVGPKWVLARYRMHDLLAALDAGYEGTLTDLAQSFGWYDHPHFTRTFKTLVGVPPSDYRRPDGALSHAS